MSKSGTSKALDQLSSSGFLAKVGKGGERSRLLQVQDQPKEIHNEA